MSLDRTAQKEEQIAGSQWVEAGHRRNIGRGGFAGRGARTGRGAGRAGASSSHRDQHSQYQQTNNYQQQPKEVQNMVTTGASGWGESVTSELDSSIRIAHKGNDNSGWSATKPRRAWSKEDQSTEASTVSPGGAWGSNVSTTKKSDAWGSTTKTVKTDDPWAPSNQTVKANDEAWGSAQTFKAGEDAWGPSTQMKTTDTWGTGTTAGTSTMTPTTAQSAHDESWSSGMSQMQTGWDPNAVSWMKTMDEPVNKKEAGRGEWKDGRHIIAERDIATEKKLFGESDADFVHSGINFDQYENIPIKVEDKMVFEAMEAFTSPPLNDHLLSNIKLAQYTTPTPVQKYSVPIVMAGRDLMACAQTGSGKTAGFLFPVLSKLFNEGPQDIVKKTKTKSGLSGVRVAYPEILILAPTRELASQIYSETKKFAYRSYVRPCVAYGGADISQQLRLLGRGCQVLVATPGRLVDILERKRVSLCNVRYLVLDEADRMLDMGFEPQIRRIVQGEDMPNPGERQTLMFSATFPKSIQVLAREFLHDYVFFTVGKVGGASENITQEIILIEGNEKRNKLMEIFENSKKADGLTLVFVETKRMADSLCSFLTEQGKRATSIHGDRLQREREEALQAFKSGETPILVATAVAARGLDIPNVKLVISYDVPKDIDDYTHRIGRTGRAGNTGHAIALFDRSNRFLAADLVALLKEAKQSIPDWLQKMADEPLPAMDNNDQQRRWQTRRRDPFDGIGLRMKDMKF